MIGIRAQTSSIDNVLTSEAAKRTNKSILEYSLQYHCKMVKLGKLGMLETLDSRH